MVGLLLPNNQTNILIAAAIAHFNGGYFQQNIPPGWITVENEDSLRVERSMILQALGRPCSDSLWASLLEKPMGQVITADENVIVIEQVMNRACIKERRRGAEAITNCSIESKSNPDI